MGVTLRHFLDTLRLYFPWVANQKETLEDFLMGASPEVKDREGSRERRVRVLKTLTQSCAWASTIWIFSMARRLFFVHFLLKLVHVRILLQHTFSPNPDSPTEAG